MGYITKEQVASIRENLKKEFPNLKFSVTRQHHSSLNVSIMSGDIDFSELLKDVTSNLSLNPYGQYREEENAIVESDRKFAPFAKTFNRIIQIMKGADWYDKSDIMTDYFNTAYYLSLSIGQYQKPYQLKKK